MLCRWVQVPSEVRYDWIPRGSMMNSNISPRPPSDHEGPDLRMATAKLRSDPGPLTDPGHLARWGTWRSPGASRGLHGEPTVPSAGTAGLQPAVGEFHPAVIEKGEFRTARRVERRPGSPNTPWDLEYHGSKVHPSKVHLIEPDP